MKDQFGVEIKTYKDYIMQADKETQDAFKHKEFHFTTEERKKLRKNVLESLSEENN